MENSNKKEIIIASTNFLEQLGLKTIINVIGLKHNLSEVCSLRELQNVLQDKASSQTYIIITDNFFDDKISFDYITGVCKQCNILYVCDKIPDNNAIKHFILNSCSSKDTYEKFYSFFHTSDKDEKELKSDTSMLSDREIDVLKEVARGFSNKEIAEKLYISINTVISHRKNITDKLDIKSISGLTVYALMNNLIIPDEIKG